MRDAPKWQRRKEAAGIVPTSVYSLLLAFLLASAISVTAQIAPPVPAQTPAVSPEVSQAPGRLEQMELTYRDALQKRHRKLIDQYLLDLKAAQVSALTEPEKAAYAAEIARITRLITTGNGIVEPPQTRIDAGRPTVATGQIPGQVYSLDPHETIVPGTVGADHVMLGEQSWRLSKLAAGTYQIVAEYACVEVPADAKVEVSFAGQTEKSEVAAGMKTRDNKTYLLLRLGRIELDEDVTDQVFTATASGTTPWLQVKRILVARVMRKPKVKP